MSIVRLSVAFSLLTAGLFCVTLVAKESEDSNKYVVRSGYYTTSVTGTNSRTGSTWNTNTLANGDMYGTDAKGNYWEYDASTRIYRNHGTGCVRSGSKEKRIEICSAS